MTKARIFKSGNSQACAAAENNSGSRLTKSNSCAGEMRLSSESQSAV